MESNHTSVAIIDCSINTPSIVCFNRMQMASPLKLTYHHISKIWSRESKNGSGKWLCYLVATQMSRIVSNSKLI